MRVLIIPEDQELDRYILLPVIEKLFDELGRKARVEVLPEPRLRGTSDALDRSLIAQIVADNRAMTDMFLLVLDRDCNRERHEERVADLESSHGGVLLAALAVEEVECWMLALFDEWPGAVTWGDVRRECDPKERFAEPFLDGLASRNGSVGPGRGRKATMRSLPGNWRRLISRCDEVRDLMERIRAHLDGGA